MNTIEIKSGEFRQRANIEYVIGSAVDAFGQETLTYGVYCPIWCKIETISGRELDLARSIGGTETHRITTRYVPNVAITMRLNFNGRHFAINAIDNVNEQNVKLVLTVTEDLKNE